MCELPQAYCHDTPRARRQHVCCDCKGTIQIGETYHNHHGVWDGSGDSFKLCSECNQLHIDVDKDERDLEFNTAFGLLYETVFESGNPEFIKRFMDTKRRRGAPIQQWMIDREIKLCEKEIAV